MFLRPSISVGLWALLAFTVYTGLSDAHAQRVGHRGSLSVLVGEKPVTIEERGRAGGERDSADFSSPALGAGAAQMPLDRHGWHATTVVGGVFLRATAEQAAGGDTPAKPDERKIVAVAGTSEHRLRIDGGSSMEGRPGTAVVPVRLWFKPAVPSVEFADDLVYWTYAVNLLAAAGDPETGAVRWEEKRDFSDQSIVLFGQEIRVPQGTNFNQSGPVMLEVPVVFGRPQLLALTTGVSVAMPSTRQTSPGEPGPVARLEVLVRMLPDDVAEVRDSEGKKLGSGDWVAEFLGRGQNATLPELMPPDLIRDDAAGAAGVLIGPAAPGLDYVVEIREDSGGWRPWGSTVSGGGNLRSWVLPPATHTSLFRLRYSLSP